MFSKPPREIGYSQLAHLGEIVRDRDIGHVKFLEGRADIFLRWPATKTA